MLMLLAAWAQPRYDYSKLRMEQLDRGVVAIRQTDGRVFVSWRTLRSDRKAEPFNIYRNGLLLNATPLTEGGTCFIDEAPTADDAVYRVEGGERNGEFTLRSDAPVGYLPISINKPEGGTSPDGWPYDYTANDCSVGDVDGDGQYEIIVKWDPTNSHDNAHDGFTGPTLFDCYRLNGHHLWRIDMGRNIRSGAHYVPFIVYDLDGDGCAELMVKTADGTRDAKGNIIGDATADYRYGADTPQKRLPKRGRILEGPEYISVFSALTGEVLDTKPYIPERGNLSDWGDDRGNRSERYLAAVGYLDGEHASAIFCRGYYTRTVLAAWDWDGHELKRRWVFDTNEEPWHDYAGQGNHNLRVADIDGDGRDEITYGSMCVDDNGTGYYNTRLGHGDAMHLCPMLPLSEHLYLWDVHEDKYYSEFRDAQTGQILWMLPHNDDVGRGLAADIDPDNPGWEMWASNTKGIRDYKGNLLDSITRVSINFALWWDGDLCRELLDHETVSKYRRPKGTPASEGEADPDAKLELTLNPNSGVRCETLLKMEGCQFNNGTKSNPSLCCDIVGDWREEVVTRTADNSALRIYITPMPTPYRFHTFLHDPVYRASVTAQNVAYNQPTGVGFFIGAELAGSGRKFRGWQF